MNTHRLSLSERIDFFKLHKPTEIGTDNIVTRKIKECAQMPIGSYFCAFDSSLQRLIDAAVICSTEIDIQKTTYGEVAQLAYDMYFSKHDKPCAVEIMKQLLVPVIHQNFDYTRSRKTFESPTRSFEERLSSAIYYTPFAPKLFNFNVKSYMLGIYSYTGNEEYNEYFEMKYNEPVQGKTMKVSNWLAISEKAMQSGEIEYINEAENDLLYMLVKPFVEYNKISSKGEN